MVRNVDCIVEFNNEFIDMKINIDKCFKKKKERKLTKYNIYMKNNYHRIKAIYPELKPTEIMGMIAKEWQNEKLFLKCVSLFLISLMKKNYSQC